MPNPVEAELKKAAKGLSYMSETDEPVHTFTWKDGDGPLTPEKLRELSKSDPQSKVDEVKLDDFFLTQDDEKFARLRKVIEDNLSDAKAYRVGDVNVTYYVVGKSKQGDWTGISTKAVET